MSKSTYLSGWIRGRVGGVRSFGRCLLLLLFIIILDSESAQLTSLATHIRLQVVVLHHCIGTVVFQQLEGRHLIHIYVFLVHLLVIVR